MRRDSPGSWRSKGPPPTACGPCCPDLRTEGRSCHPTVRSLGPVGPRRGDVKPTVAGLTRALSFAHGRRSPIGPSPGSAGWHRMASEKRPPPNFLPSRIDRPDQDRRTPLPGRPARRYGRVHGGRDAGRAGRVGLVRPLRRHPDRPGHLLPALRGTAALCRLHRRPYRRDLRTEQPDPRTVNQRLSIGGTAISATGRPLQRRAHDVVARSPA
jgi:hypothetical protein